MIPQNQRPGATPLNVTGETAAFTIKANGKAFRILIDGLYSNKVLAVIRELCSNAADSHAAAKQSKPFKVQIPTSMDPTFRVRDYGTSLTHDEVMHLYTKIFESTKEETNDQTGQLGLGSKSPFAYTDTFQVVAWLDGVERTYIAHLATDGVPSITFMGDRPSNEPQGLEVSFPAKREDITRFQREMSFVSLAYRDCMPEIDGMRIVLPEARLTGNGWAIYPRQGVFDSTETRHFIRQGSAVYPNRFSFPHLGYGWVSIIDVPIGTADVTASRDALAYTEDTEKRVQAIVQGAYAEVQAQIQSEIDAATTRVEKAKVWSTYVGVFDNVRGRTTVSLVKDEQNRKLDPLTNRYVVELGESLELAKKYGKTTNSRYRYNDYNRYTSEVEYNHLKNFRLVVDDLSEKLVRRYKRIQNLGETHGLSYVVSSDDPAELSKAVDWVRECLSLTDDQIIRSSDLPDCPPPKVVRSTSGRRVPAPGQYWMPRYEGVVLSPIFGNSDKGPQEWPTRLLRAMSYVEDKLDACDWDDIFWVNERQQEAHEKRGELDPNLRLDVVVHKLVEKRFKKLPVDDAVTYRQVVRFTGSSNRALPVVLSEFFPTLKVSKQVTEEIFELMDLLKIELQTLPITDKVTQEINKLSEEYPLLFQRSDTSHYEHYVKAVKATASAKP